jgi:hypothetical protein
VSLVLVMPVVMMTMAAHGVQIRQSKVDGQP